MMPKEKEELRGQLYARDGHDCHYCNIPEDTVLMAWKQIYDQDKRGRRLEVDRKEMKGKFLDLPNREDIPENIREQLIVELYSK